MERKSRRCILFAISFLFIYFCSLSRVEAQYEFSDNYKSLKVQTKYLVLDIKKNPWHMRLEDRNGKVIYEEARTPQFFVKGQWRSVGTINKVKKKSGKIQLDLDFDGSEKAEAEIEVINENSFRVIIEPNKGADSLRIYNKLTEGENVFGFGEMWNGSVGQRGKMIDLYDQNGTPDECAYIPFYVTTKNYSFFLDYGGRVLADVGKSDKETLLLQAPASKASILLTGGKNLPEAVAGYLKVTGLPILPPRWAFKPWFWLITPYDQPKGKYSASDILAAARMYKELDIPVGVTWMEPAWQTAGNSFEPSAKFSSDFKKFVEQLHEMDLKVLCWTTPYTQPNSPNYKEALSANYFAKNEISAAPKPKAADGNRDPDFANHYIDYTSPAARQWWQTQIKKVLDLGIDGFKLDAGQDLPEDGKLYLGAGKDFHNAFARYYNQTYFEILDRLLKGNFLTVPRSAWSGSNQYSVFKWPGDLMASFADNGLPSSVYSSISVGFSGFPYVSTDIGGFSGRPTTEQVWIRWAQFGAMIPGMQTLNMPWWFSKRASDYYRYLSWLHTDLVPFWMSLAHEAHREGTPIIRHLVWTFPNDRHAVKTDDEYTLGESILVAPVMNSDSVRQVYLPKGTWFDFWNNKKVEGGKQFSWSGDLYSFPLYIREGAIIPLEIQNRVSGFGTEMSKGYRTIAIWPKERGSSSFNLEDQGPAVTIKTNAINPNLMQLDVTGFGAKYIFRVYKSDNWQPKKIESGSKSLPIAKSFEEFNSTTHDNWFYETDKKLLWVKWAATKKNNNLHIYY
jgi:alpha-D-xyloside xylohydrolase